MNSHSHSNIIDRITDLMVEIPKGEITMRDDRLKDTWIVKIHPFFLSKHLLTQELYKEITNNDPSEFKGNKRPVECVSWEDATKFCNLLSAIAGLNPCYIIDLEKEEIKFDHNANGFRLPSEFFVAVAGMTKPEVVWLQTEDEVIQFHLR